MAGERVAGLRAGGLARAVDEVAYPLGVAVAGGREGRDGALPGEYGGVGVGGV